MGQRFPKRSSIKGGWRSGLEDANAKHLTSLRVKFLYEKVTLRYTEPETLHRYTPDFVLPNGIVIETKGRFQSGDRKKHKLVKAQHPSLDVRFVFTNPYAKLNKRSKTTYAKWCDDHGFQWAHGLIPEAWTHEPKNRKSWDTLRKYNVKKGAYNSG